MLQRIDFVPAGSVSIVLPPTGAVAAMPAIDGSNVATAVTNTGPSAVSVLFGTSAAMSAAVPGAVQIQPGATVLMTTSAIAAAASAPQGVNVSGPVAATATYIAAASTYGPINLTVTRGTATVVSYF